MHQTSNVIFKPRGNFYEEHHKHFIHNLTKIGNTMKSTFAKLSIALAVSVTAAIAVAATVPAAPAKARAHKAPAQVQHQGAAAGVAASGYCDNRGCVLR